MYKLYSGILASNLIRVSKENNWVTVEQKGFLPGITDIQEHTFIFESATLEAKKKTSNLFISCLDLSNTFGSIQNSKLLIIQRSTYSRENKSNSQRYL